MTRGEYQRYRQTLWREPEQLVLARLIYGEARGEDIETQTAVAQVVKNRAAHPKWWGNSVKEVCLKRYQFSCFNFSDPNMEQLMNASLDDKIFLQCIGVAFAVMNGLYEDKTNGATHYHNKSIAPYWNKKMTQIYETEKLIFYR